jgi:hypothetical protein
MQSQDINKDQNKDRQNQQGLKDDDKFAGSSITDPEEKELRKFDDWHSHKHEKHHADLKDAGCFREGELHGVVGKEIYDEVEREKRENMQQLKNKPKEMSQGQQHSQQK